MENVKEQDAVQEQVCECGAHVRGDVSYCPRCGELLPDAKISVVSKKVYDSLKDETLKVKRQLSSIERMGYAPYGNRIIEDEEYNELKKKADSYDNILFGLGLIGVCFLAAIVCVSIAIFEDEPKTGIEIVKDEATGKYGIYNHDKDIQTVPFAYDTIVFDGYYRTYYLTNILSDLSGFKFGVADSIGNITIPCEMDSFHSVGNDMSIMYRNGMQGVYHRDGHIIIPCENQYVFWEKKPKGDFYTPSCRYIGNIIPVKRSSNYGWDLYNKLGERIGLRTYQEAIQTGTRDIIKVKYNGYYGWINSKGVEIIKCKARWISRFQEGIAFVDYPDCQNLYAIDTLGTSIFSISKEYQSQWPVSEGLFARNDNNGKIGYYDKTGKLVIPHKFEQAEDRFSPSFQGDSARISYNGQNGYVFKDGSIKLDAQ